MQQNISTKPRYEILDGLRGIAAVIVVAYHVFEGHANGSHIDQVINHGYLAVDFFFLLSGFVIGYAYDDRWNKGLSIGSFFKRRLIRLQPMVVLGSVIGAACFYFSDSATFFPLIHDTPFWQLLLVMLAGTILLPLPPTGDIRGGSEMYPLNGPAWSLFFEYCANILYALFIRKCSKKVLILFVTLAGLGLISLAIAGPNGDITGGWTLDGEHVGIGFIRLIYPFFAGLLLFRISKIGKINRNTFFWCSLLIIILLTMPRICENGPLWINGIYDSVVIVLLFPLIVWFGARGTLTGKYSSKICRFLGQISYPLYLSHYPLIYIYMGYISNHNLKFSQSFPYAILTFVSSLLLGWACLKLYDLPVRKWLTGITNDQLGIRN